MSGLPFNINHAKITGYQGNKRFYSSRSKIDYLLEQKCIYEASAALNDETCDWKKLKSFELKYRKPAISHRLECLSEFAIDTAKQPYHCCCTSLKASNWQSSISNCHEAGMFKMHSFSWPVQFLIGRKNVRMWIGWSHFKGALINSRWFRIYAKSSRQKTIEVCLLPEQHIPAQQQMLTLIQLNCKFPTKITAYELNVMNVDAAKCWDE